jgi:hypothetical protein
VLLASKCLWAEICRPRWCATATHTEGKAVFPEWVTVIAVLVAASMLWLITGGFGLASWRWSARIIAATGVLALVLAVRFAGPRRELVPAVFATLVVAICMWLTALFLWGSGAPLWGPGRLEVSSVIGALFGGAIWLGGMCVSFVVAVGVWRSRLPTPVAVSLGLIVIVIVLIGSTMFDQSVSRLYHMPEVEPFRPGEDTVFDEL